MPALAMRGREKETQRQIKREKEGGRERESEKERERRREGARQRRREKERACATINIQFIKSVLFCLLQADLVLRFLGSLDIFCVATTTTQWAGESSKSEGDWMAI